MALKMVKNLGKVGPKYTPRQTTWAKGQYRITEHFLHTKGPKLKK